MEAQDNADPDRLAQVVGFWRQVSFPTPDDPIILPDAIDLDFMALLKKGSAFARLAESIGINDAAKRSRQIARNAGLSFDGFHTEFINAVRNYNLEVIRLRGVAYTTGPTVSDRLEHLR